MPLGRIPVRTAGSVGRSLFAGAEADAVLAGAAMAVPAVGAQSHKAVAAAKPSLLIISPTPRRPRPRIFQQSQLDKRLEPVAPAAPLFFWRRLRHQPANRRFIASGEPARIPPSQ